MAKWTRLSNTEIVEMYDRHFFDDDDGTPFDHQTRFEIAQGCFDTGGMLEQYESLLETLIADRALAVRKHK